MEPINQNYDGIPQDAEKRKFEGIWIPAEIWLDENINGHERLLYAEIASFGSRGCWKKSEELMKLLGVGREAFQRTCRNLRERGYITEKRMFGRIVRTTTLAFCSSDGNRHQSENQAVHQAVSPTDEQAVSPTVQKEYTKEYTKVKGDESVAEGVENSEKKQYGREDINELVDLWQAETGIDIKGQQNQRRQLYNLLRKYGADGTKALVRRVGNAIRSGDRFAPQIATPSDLTGKYSKLARLDMWETRNQLARPFGQGSAPQEDRPTPEYLRGGIPDYNGAFIPVSDEEHEKVSQMFKEARKTLPFLQKKGGQK